MKIGLRIGLVLAVLGGGFAVWRFGFSGPTVIEAGELTVSEETRRLGTGELLIERLEPTGGEGVAARAKAVIEAPVSKVWPAVRDCQHFKEFMPRTLQSELRESKGNERLCYVELDMPWPLDPVGLETLSTIEELPKGAFRRSWRMTQGKFKHNTGSYQVEPFNGDASRTLLTYTVDALPDLPVPDAVLRNAQASTLPKMFDAIGQRAGAPARAR